MWDREPREKQGRLYHYDEEVDSLHPAGIWSGFRGVLLCVLCGAVYGALLGGAIGGVIGLGFFIIGVIYGLPIGLFIGLIAGATCGFFAGVLGERWGWAVGSGLGAALDFALCLNGSDKGPDGTTVGLILLAIAATAFLGYMVHQWVWFGGRQGATFFTPFAQGLTKVGYLRTTPLDRLIGGVLVLLLAAAIAATGYAALRG